MAEDLLQAPVAADDAAEGASANRMPTGTVSRTARSVASLACSAWRARFWS